MLDEPRLLEAPRVHDESRTAEVAQVGVRILAGVVLDGDVREQGVGSALIRWYHILAQHTVVGEVVDNQGWRSLLLRIAQDVGKSCVQDPQPIATIGAHAERRDDFRHPGGAVLMRLPGRIGDQRW